jgi:hypothetical protein
VQVARFVLSAAGFAVLLSFSSGHAGARAADFPDVRSGSARPAIAVPDCLGKPKVRPKSMTFTCADAGFYADGLGWLAWGGRTAVALGNAHANDCTPDCASGRFHRYRILVLLTGRQRCPDGRQAYVRATYAFIGASPFPADAPGTRQPFVNFHCR